MANKKSLDIFLYGRHIGKLHQSTNGGAISLTYNQNSQATLVPLSESLPIRTAPHTGIAVRAFIEGLLPEGENARISIANKFGISPRNPFALLENIGADCAGAVQFLPELDTQDSNAQAGLIEISESEIAARLAKLSQSSNESWVINNERWSLAGAQSKIALRLKDGLWHETIGAEPNSHILKPGIPSFRDQALNEHLCLTALKHLGLKVAESKFHNFAGFPAIVITRYDRVSTDSGKLLRIHQEDFCQATATLPQNKYESNKGPNAQKIIQTLRKSSAPHESTEQFILGLVSNYLLGAPDAHAKNYSILKLPDGSAQLAPLYDIASAFPYNPESGSELSKAAMAIGNERRFFKLERKHWEKLAFQCELNPSSILFLVEDLATRLPQAITSTIESSEPEVQNSELAGRLFEKIDFHCRVTLQQL